MDETLSNLRRPWLKPGGRTAACVGGVSWRNASIRATVPTTRSVEEPWDSIHAINTPFTEGIVSMTPRFFALTVALLSAIAVGLIFTSVAAQRSPAPEPESELARNFAAEHEIGRRFQSDPADLPAPEKRANRDGQVADNPV